MLRHATTKESQLSHFPNFFENKEKQIFLAANDQRSHVAPMFSTQARYNPEKVNLQHQVTPFYPIAGPDVATTSVPDQILPPSLIPASAPMPHAASSSNHGNEMLYHLLEKQG